MVDSGIRRRPSALSGQVALVMGGYLLKLLSEAWYRK